MGAMEVPTKGEEVEAARPFLVFPKIWAKEETSMDRLQQTRMESEGEGLGMDLIQGLVSGHCIILVTDQQANTNENITEIAHYFNLIRSQSSALSPQLSLFFLFHLLKKRIGRT